MGVTSGNRSGLNARSNSGNTTNVINSTGTCSRQWFVAAITASRESFAHAGKTTQGDDDAGETIYGGRRRAAARQEAATTSVPITIVKLSGETWGGTCW